MALQSQQYMQQLEQMGDMPDYKSVIAEAYDKPVVRGVVNNIADVESKYLPSLFETFANQGTGAADMSAAAKLAMIGGKLGRLTSQANAGGNVLGFYDATVDRLAGTASNDWQNRKQTLTQLYQMAFQQEEAERQERARQAQAAAAAAQANHLKALMDQQKAAAQGAAIDVDPKTFQNAAQLNAYRAAKGLGPVSDSYFENTYKPSQSYTPYTQSKSSVGAERLDKAWRNPDNSLNLTDNWGEKALTFLAAPGIGLGQLTGWY